MFVKKITKKPTSVKASIKAENCKVRRAVRASEEEEVMDEEIIDDEVESAPVEVAPEASDLLFEAEDVAELVAEITGQDVSVTAEDDVVTFEVGDDSFAVEAEGDEEILESTRRPLKGKAPVKASKRVAARRAARARR